MRTRVQANNSARAQRKVFRDVDVSKSTSRSDILNSGPKQRSRTGPLGLLEDDLSDLAERALAKF